jgi:hypothetical protein
VLKIAEGGIAMKKFVILLICSLFLPNVTLFSQETIKINGQIRYRYELAENNFDGDSKPNNSNLLRTRIGLSYMPTSKFSTFFQLQDSRIMGEENSTLDGSAKQFDMHQAYMNIDSIFQVPLALQIGRYEVSYSNQRLIGAVGWHNIGRSLDGGTLSYRSGLGPIDLFSFQINEDLMAGNTGDIYFHGIWGNFKICEQLKTDLFILARREIGTKRLNEQTLGATISGQFGNLSGVVEAAYQIGRLDSSRDISASLVAVNLTYALPDVVLKPSILAGIDYLSGDDNTDDGTYKVFNTLYATNHKFYGIMDYFLNIPIHTGGYGLTDINAGVSANLCEKSKIIMRYHRFMSSKKYLLPDSSQGSTFGDEIDLIVNYRYNKILKIEAGGGLFIPGEIFKATRGKDNGLFVYLSVLANL